MFRVLWLNGAGRSVVGGRIIVRKDCIKVARCRRWGGGGGSK